jgi:endonuclease-3
MPSRKSSPLKRKTAKIADVLQGFMGDYKWRRRRNPLDQLIATILSQNTSDLNSGRAYRSLRERFPKWEDILAADVKDIADAIRAGGLADRKSRCIKETLSWIKATYGRLNIDFICKMEPEEVYETLCQIKGIGVKTVSVVLAFACGKDVFPVDTHVNRICDRLGLVPPNSSPEKTFRLMQGLFPKGRGIPFHVNMIDFGREVCKSQNPKCHQCPLTRYCQYYKEILAT